MGRVGGFLDFKRKDLEHRPVRDRLKDFSPVELPPLEAEVRAQAARCMDCGIPFCHGSGCPLANIIPEMNDMVYRGRWKEALEILLSTNNFPEFTGRLCPAPCEKACVLDINDEPVTIRQIELAIIEKGFERGYVKAEAIPRIRKSAAVIGSGPAGLAVADTLNRGGCDVTVYDRARSAGGLLRYGIPDFKLDKAVIDRRVNLMEEEGVTFELGVTVGEDVSYKFLADRFDTICLAGGSREPRDLPAPGRELGGIHFAGDYLTLQNMVLAGEDVSDREMIHAKGKRVVVIGGGDTGSDCLGTALRQKAKSVTQFEILPEPPRERPEHTPWPAWPAMLRESTSHEEGGERRWSVTTKAFVGKEGRLTGLRCAEVEWSKDDAGQWKFEEKPDSEFDVEADLVLLAMGFVGPGPNKLVDELGLERDARGNIKVDSVGQTSVEGVFAAGDVATGQSLIVRAIADSRRVAGGMLEYLNR